MDTDNKESRGPCVWAEAFILKKYVKFRPDKFIIEMVYFSEYNLNRS